MTGGRICAICGRKMREFKGIYMCLECNDKYGEYYNFLSTAVSEFKKPDGKDVVLIECPGATVYDETNTEIVKGVKWNNPNDFTEGHTIVGSPIYAPAHQKKRMVPKENLGSIARCQACQDFTVRLRIFNNQKMKGEYTHESPLMPRNHPKASFDPRKPTDTPPRSR
ncbi:MAG: DC1 domain-containing protein [candidate division Zixibacteria bacterium]|nr:DC1 domain-containing protein [candidate division Zixibacteria bacterium]MBU1471518.1 DC1 domain-containing protein [candidate division Zixibacteria bacterium]MBU2626251.1 DC1 domain-containing protein [candidate division Zixibacteria bacterium]